MDNNTMIRTTCTKRYTDLPFAHRQPAHGGHCRYIHGHNATVEFEFVALDVDTCGFVVDFGGLKPVKDWLERTFDHTVLLNADDPMAQDPAWLSVVGLTNRVDGGPTPPMPDFVPGQDWGNMRIVDDCSAEGLARLCFDEVDELVQQMTGGRVSVRRVTFYEDSKNWATVEAAAVLKEVPVAMAPEAYQVGEPRPPEKPYNPLHPSAVMATGLGESNNDNMA